MPGRYHQSVLSVCNDRVTVYFFGFFLQPYLSLIFQIHGGRFLIIIVVTGRYGLSFFAFSGDISGLRVIQRNCFTFRGASFTTLYEHNVLYVFLVANAAKATTYRRPYRYSACRRWRKGFLSSLRFPAVSFLPLDMTRLSLGFLWKGLWFSNAFGSFFGVGLLCWKRLRRWQQKGRVGVLLVRSSGGLYRVLHFRLRGRRRRMRVYVSKHSKLSLILRSTCSLVLLSHVLPAVGKLLILRGTQDGNVSAPIVVVATLKRLCSHIRKLSYNTSSCLMGPFTCRRLSTHVHSVNEHGRMCSSGGQFSCTSVACSDQLQRLAKPGKKVRLSKQRKHLLRVFLRGPSVVLRHLILLSHM